MTKKLLAVAVAALGLTACASQSQNKETEESETPKALVLYYSQTGATKTVAEAIQSHTGADIESIELENPYDGDFQQTIERCQKEKAAGELPTLKPLKSNISDYDVVFLGFPVWFGTYAPPVEALLKESDFAGKKVVSFCTFGSGGLQSSTNDLKAALPKAEVIEGYGVRNARLGAVEKEITRFLIEGGYVEGEIEPLADFSEPAEVTDEDVCRFNEACSDYQFPLGTPVTVGSRANGDGMEYIYTAKSQGPDGSESTSTIYVVQDSTAGAKAEFTQVVR